MELPTPWEGIKLIQQQSLRVVSESPILYPPVFINTLAVGGTAGLGQTQCTRVGILDIIWWYPPASLKLVAHLRAPGQGQNP